MRSLATDLNDWFSFNVRLPAPNQTTLRGGLRFHVQSYLDSRLFEAFHIDIGVGDPLTQPSDDLAMPALAEFAGIPPTIVQCYPITQQIAEKLHAYTRPHASGESTRPKDLTDILLLAALERISAPTLLSAIEATFAASATHPLPVSLPAPPPGWSGAFRRLAHEVDLQNARLADAYQDAQQFFNPVLRRETNGIWDPVLWSWGSGKTELREPP